jgi:hypothetical protein
MTSRMGDAFAQNASDLKHTSANILAEHGWVHV